MRTVIRAKLLAGESDQQIIAYFVERYGEGVLVEPPRHGLALVAWLGLGGLDRKSASSVSGVGPAS